MTSSCPKRPWACRVVPTVLGIVMFSLGVHLGEFWGLLLMIVGLVPVVIGVADISVIGEIRDERAHRREQRPVAPLPYERGA